MTAGHDRPQDSNVLETTLSGLALHVGKEIFTSDWIDVTQERIDRFAEATGDLQWLHVDPERARRESPYGGTVAHGYLTLSLIPAMLAAGLRVTDARMGVNYGLNRVRFPAPVPAGSRVRGRFVLKEHSDLPNGNGARLVLAVTVEREGSEKPCCLAETVSLRLR